MHFREQDSSGSTLCRIGHDLQRVDGCKVISGFIVMIRNRLAWHDVSRENGRDKTVYNLFGYHSRIGIFDNIFVALENNGLRPQNLMIETTQLKARRTAAIEPLRRYTPLYHAYKTGVELQIIFSVREELMTPG